MSTDDEVNFHPRHDRHGNSLAPVGKPPKDEQRAVAAFKVPPFESDRAEKFFCLCEDRFTAVGIYDANLRASCIMEYLPPNLVEMLTQRYAEFSRAKDRYLAIKDAVLEYSRRPFWARMQAIHALPHVGNMSPTQLMCRIILLKAPEEPFYEMLRFEFLRRLPVPLFEKYKSKCWIDPMAFAIKVESDWSRSNAQSLTSSGSEPTSSNRGPEETSGVRPAAAGINAVQGDDTDAIVPPQDLVSTLQPLVAVLQRVVARGQPTIRRISSARRGTFRGADPYPGRGRGGRGGGWSQPMWQNQDQNQDQRTSRQEWCFYHQRFGASAWSCRQPCTYNRRTPSSNNA